MVFSSCCGNLGYLLELWQGQTLTTLVFSVTAGLPSSTHRHLISLNYTWQNNTDASGGLAGDRGSLSSWCSDIGTPIHFQEESDIVTL